MSSWRRSWRDRATCLLGIMCGFGPERSRGARGPRGRAGSRASCPLLDRDPLRDRLLGLRRVNLEDALLEGRRDLAGVDLRRQREPALERALEALVETEGLLLLLRRLLALALDGELVVAHLERQLLLLVAGHLELDDELVGRLVHVCGRRQRGEEPGVIEQAPHPPLDHVEVAQRRQDRECHKPPPFQVLPSSRALHGRASGRPPIRPAEIYRASAIAEKPQRKPGVTPMASGCRRSRLGAMKRIIVATDGSDGGHAAVAEGASLARALGAAITIVHVRPAITFLGEPLYQRRLSNQLERARQAVDDALARLEREGLEADYEILEGNAGDEIVRIAEARHADLIVIGSRGLGPVSGALLGSGSRSLVRPAH